MLVLPLLWSVSMCDNPVMLLATTKRATFLQNILYESCSKFDFEQCSLKKSLKILIFQWEYMEMCFHGNQLSWGIKHPFISLWSKYHSPGFIHLSTMLAPVISSLDEIYCIKMNQFVIKSNTGEITILTTTRMIVWKNHSRKL